MKGCQVLVSLLDRKAKLLGMDAPVKVEPPSVVVPETEEQRVAGRGAIVFVDDAGGYQLLWDNDPAQVTARGLWGQILMDDMD
jgi:hypothetical protein